jgi:hypothetical protein
MAFFFSVVVMENDANIKSDEKTGRKESVYPVFDLVEALKFATAVKDLGGTRGTVARSILAQHFSLPESSPSFFQRLGAAKSFGIVDGHGSYSLSSEGKRYFYPTSEKDKALAALNFLTSPTAFAKIVELFDGEKLPKTELLGNILHKETSVPISWKDRAVQIFLRSAQHLGIIDQNGILRYSAAKHSESSNAGSSENETEIPTPKEQIEQPIVLQKRVASQLNANSKTWSLTEDNRTVFVEHPRDISMQEWEGLNQYVLRIKPNDKTP